MKKFLMLLLLSDVCLAADVVWLKLEPKFAYKDLSVICSNDEFGRPTRYFGAEVEAGKIVRAVIQSNFMAGFQDPIFLKPEEIKDVVLFRDASGILWIKSFRLSQRLNLWFFYRSSGYECKPPQELLTTEPVNQVYEFPMEAIEQTGYSDSNIATFSGRRKDNGFYQAKLGFIQRQYDGKQ